MALRERDAKLGHTSPAFFAACSTLIRMGYPAMYISMLWLTRCMPSVQLYPWVRRPCDLRVQMNLQKYICGAVRLIYPLVLNEPRSVTVITGSLMMSFCLHVQVFDSPAVAMSLRFLSSIRAINAATPEAHDENKKVAFLDAMVLSSPRRWPPEEPKTRSGGSPIEMNMSSPSLLSPYV